MGVGPCERDVFKCSGKRSDRFNLGHLPPFTLQACCQHDPFPVGLPLVRPFPFQFNHAALGLNRVKASYAQFCAFFEYPIHFVAFWQCLKHVHWSI